MKLSVFAVLLLSSIFFIGTPAAHATTDGALVNPDEATFWISNHAFAYGEMSLGSKAWGKLFVEIRTEDKDVPNSFHSERNILSDNLQNLSDLDKALDLCQKTKDAAKDQKKKLKIYFYADQPGLVCSIPGDHVDPK